MSRILTKVFLGHFGCVKDIFDNNFRAPKVIFVKIWSFWRLVSQGSMVAGGGAVRHGGPKITILEFKKWSRDMVLGLSLKCFWIILSHLNLFLQLEKWDSKRYILLLNKIPPPSEKSRSLLRGGILFKGGFYWATECMWNVFFPQKFVFRKNFLIYASDDHESKCVRKPWSRRTF